MESANFRIIAVRVFPECEKWIMRALLPNVTYFFYNDYGNDYDENGEWAGIKKCNDTNKAIPSDFFSISKLGKNTRHLKKNPVVSVSAIVGKNGDGKSSLVELMLRIINNFSVEYGFKEDQESLVHINGVDAILFYELDGYLYFIKCSNEIVEASFAKIGEKDVLKKHQESLFYTIVANYSIYAYNSKNFEREVDEGESCWINGIFHKNDSYQTPIVLNPMRTEGNFDVNREEDLCRQRLMALYADLGDDEEARVINDNKIASGFAFNLETVSKLETVTLKSYFQTTWKSTELNSATDNFKSYIKNLEENVTQQYKLLARQELESQILFWQQYDTLWDKYRPLFTLSEQVEKQIYKDNSADYNGENTDLKNYLFSAKWAFEGIIDNASEKKRLLASLDKVKSICGNLTGLQLQRLVLIIDVCELWEKHPWFKKNTFSNAIKQYVERKNSRGAERCHAILYVIYKTISIFSQYSSFVNLFDVNLRYFNLFDQKFKDGSEYYNRLPQCFNQLFIDKEKQHIVKKYNTLKLRQTINYLIYHSFRLNPTNNGYTHRDFGYKNYVTFYKLQEFIKAAKKLCDEETIALLPPPIFVGDILIREGADESGFPRFKMSELSSGELQMLNSISTYLYHLRNLNYHVGRKDLIEYSYVNLILEEVELYFHPEYQREYIFRMLQQIEQVHLDNIKAINVILVTHSPFVLTDIPKNNVLFLKEGQPIRVMQEDTFGANIHSLLQNGFFLEGAPMGEFAKEKINMMFERLHRGEFGENLFDEIKLVSEPLLKTQLYQIYSLNKLPYHIPQYEELLERIKTLEEKVND